MAFAEPDCAPPDPKPAEPVRVQAPPGATDVHAHVFGPQDRYPMSPKRGYTPPEASTADWRRLHRVLGVSRGVLTQPSVYGTDNAAMLDAVATDPANLRAVAAVAADVSDAELRRLDAGGVRGIRVNLVDPGGMPFDGFADVAAFARRIAPLGWHIEYLVHVHEFAELERLGDMPVDSVVGHFGYMPADRGADDPGYRRFLKLLEGGRIWVKLTAPYRITRQAGTGYADVAQYAHALAAVRPDRLLWGTDWPHPHNYREMPNDGRMFDLLADWLPDAAVRNRVLVDNPARLYGFAGDP